MTGDRIASYFNNSIKNYQNWSPHHLHYGFWDKNTKTRHDAMVNTIENVVTKLKIKPGDQILDAGCGFGGTSRYLVENYDVTCVGISNSQEHIRLSRKKSEHISDDRIQFLVQDYTATTFEDQSFDHVLGIESVCYAKVKGEFIKEAARLLKPHGKLVVIDGFLNNGVNHFPLSYKYFLRGWLLPNLAPVDKFYKELENYYFTKIYFEGKNRSIYPSSWRIAYASIIPLLRNYLRSRLFNVSLSQFRHNLASISQLISFRKGIWVYGMFVASK